MFPTRIQSTSLRMIPGWSMLRSRKFIPTMKFSKRNCKIGIGKGYYLKFNVLVKWKHILSMYQHLNSLGHILRQEGKQALNFSNLYLSILFVLRSKRYTNLPDHNFAGGGFAHWTKKFFIITNMSVSQEEIGKKECLFGFRGSRFQFDIYLLLRPYFHVTASREAGADFFA